MAGQVLLKLPSPVGTAATVTIDNPLAEIGTILVAKAVTGDVEGYVDGTLFGITFDCTVDDFDGTNFLGDGEGILVDGIPVGTECIISETELPGPRGRLRIRCSGLLPGATVTVTAAGAVVEVLIENPLQRVPPPPEQAETWGRWPASAPCW